MTTNTSILFKAGAGVPGDLPVPGETQTATYFFDTDPIDPLVVPDAFGVPIKIVGNYIEKFQLGDTAAVIYGVLSRVAPQDPLTVQTTIGVAVPNPVREQSVILRGFTSVVCTIGTPAIGQPVYVRVVAAGPALIGDFEATADGINNELIPEYVWSVAGRDSDNISQIRIKS